MNIAEILKNCPNGTKLYSPIHGELSLAGTPITTPSTYPIYCYVISSGKVVSFTKDGKSNITDAELTLFPSKTQRDWSKFGVTNQVTDTQPKHQFKPFDKVLVRDRDDRKWGCDFFCHLGDKEGVFVCISSWWRQCIPYEGNEHLLGTTKKPEE
jgi:hypothetical protein